MVVFNKNDVATDLDLERFEFNMGEFKHAKAVFSNQDFTLDKSLSLAGKSVEIFELRE